MAFPQVGLDAVVTTNLAEKGARVLSGIYNDIERKSNAVAKVTGDAASQFVGLGNTLLNVGAIAGGAALAGVTALGAGLATFAVTGISKAIDLDQQMATIAATMNTTKDTVGPLKDLILDLALDPNLTVNTTQAADAIQLLAQNGVTMTEIMDGAAAATVALANATGAQFSTAADIASGVMKVFNIDAANMETAIDGITGVVNTSKFTIEDFGQAFAAAGGIAAEIGVSFEDFSAVIAGTATSFNSGSDAGTSFKTLLQRLANPTDENKDLMEQYGISLFDAEGKMKPFAKVVESLNTAFTGLTDAQKAQLAAQIGGADAARSVLALAGMTKKEFEDLSGTVNDSGQAFRSAATRVDSVKGAFQIFQGIVEAVQIQVGDKFLPILRGITVGFTDLASQAGPMVVDFFGRIADGIGSLIATATNLFTIFQASGTGGLVSALGLTPATTELIDKIVGSITDLANTILSTLFPALSGLTSGGALDTLNQSIEFVNLHFEEFKAAIVGIGAVLAGAAIAAAVVGIATAIAGLVTPIGLIVLAVGLLSAAWVGNWGGIQEKMFAVWAVIQPVLSGLLTAITVLVNFLTGTVFPILAVFVSMYIDVLATRAQVLADTFTGYLLPATSAVWEFISTSLMPLFQSVNNLIGAVLTKTLQAWAGLWKNVLLPAIRLVGEFISANVLPVFTQIGEVIDTKTRPAIESFTGILPDFTKGMEAVNKLIKDAISFFNGLTQAVKNFQLPAVLQPGSPPPFAIALQDIANAAKSAGTSMIGFDQQTIDALLGIERNVANVRGAIGMARDEVEEFFEGKIEDNKASRALKIMGKIFRDNSEAILGATDRAAKFKELISNVNFMVGKEGQRSIETAIGVWLKNFDINIAKLKAQQKQIFIEAGKTALEIGNKLNDIVSSSVDILDERVKTLQELVDSGLAEVNFDGQILSALQAQEMLNVALQEQRDIQDDILQLKQNEQKLSFLEKQLSLVETLNNAGLNVQDILGGISLGLDASIPDMIEATNRLVQAMIQQVNQDLQLGSPSRLMMKKGLQTGQGFVEGLMASIPNIASAMKQAIMGPSLVSGPVLGGGSGQRVVNNNFNMSVNSGASPQGIMQQFEVARAMVG